MARVRFQEDIGQHRRGVLDRQGRRVAVAGVIAVVGGDSATDLVAVDEHTGERGVGEVMSPRLAFGGLLSGVLFMIAWLTLTGLSFYVAVLLVFGSLGAFIGLSRIVAEAGLPGAQTPMVPQAFIPRGFGPEVLGLKNMTGLGLSTVWIGETAANMMNAVIHSLKLVTDGCC